MPRNLQTLIVASGNAGTSGQSFRNHVTGSGSGIGFRNYLIASASFTNPLGLPPVSHSSGTVMNVEVAFGVFNNRVHGILNRTSSAWQVSETEINGGSGQATLSSVTWTDPTASLDITLTGALTPGTPSVTVINWYDGYTSPNLPWGGSAPGDWTNCSPNCETEYDVRFQVTPQTIAAAGTCSMYVNVAIVPDKNNGAYNYLMNNISVIGDWRVSVERIANLGPTIEQEWHRDSGYSNLVSTNSSIITGSNNNSDHILYLRYRETGGGSWSNYGEVRFFDERTDT